MICCLLEWVSLKPLPLPAVFYLTVLGFHDLRAPATERN